MRILNESEKYNKKFQQMLIPLIRDKILKYRRDYNLYIGFKNSRNFIHEMVNYLEDYDIEFVVIVENFMKNNGYETRTRKTIKFDATSNSIDDLTTKFGFLLNLGDPPLFDNQMWERMKTVTTTTAKINDQGKYYGTIYVHYKMRDAQVEFDVGSIKGQFDDYGNMIGIWNIIEYNSRNLSDTINWRWSFKY